MGGKGNYFIKISYFAEIRTIMRQLTGSVSCSLCSAIR